MIETQKYIRKPLYVDAVRVTNDNFDEITTWCQGEVLSDDTPGKGTSKQYIKVRVHNPKNPRQTKAFVGDWLLYTERGYKVYTNKAFHTSFDPATMTEDEARKSMGFPPLPPTKQVESIQEAAMDAEEAAIADTEPPEGQQVWTASTEVTESIEEDTREPTVEDTRQVISEEDQKAMDPDELRELLKSGEFVLAQDLAA